MSTLFAYPPPRYVAALPRARRSLPLRGLCALAGLPCRGSGAWAERPVSLSPARSAQIIAEASPRRGVLVRVPSSIWRKGPPARARFALDALAYGLMDLVARESVRGRPEFRCTAGAGRPRTGTAISNRERQRRFRSRRARRHPAP